MAKSKCFVRIVLPNANNVGDKLWVDFFAFGISQVKKIRRSMKVIKNVFGILVLLIVNVSLLNGTPSTVFWTPCTTDVYATGTGHIDVDNYFTVFNRRGHGSAFLPLTGLEVGVVSWNDVSVEAGVDYLGSADDPLYFNVGIGLPEDTLFQQAPSFKVGLFNSGTRYHGYSRTNQNIFDVIIGKSLPDWIGGRVCVGGFSGSRAMGKDRQGFMISYQRPFCAAKYRNNRDYYKWVLCADYASGKNTIGGGGVGVYYYFTPDISILTGPVWFNSREINGRWKWSVQIDINFSIFDAKKR